MSLRDRLVDRFAKRNEAGDHIVSLSCSRGERLEGGGHGALRLGQQLPAGIGEAELDRPLITGDA